jgi:hypothetical protein
LWSSPNPDHLTRNSVVPSSILRLPRIC